MGMEQPPKHKDKLKDILRAVLPVVLFISASCSLALIIIEVSK